MKLNLNQGVIMIAIKSRLLMTLVVLITASCSVISKEVRTESEPPLRFKKLVQEADKYTGKTVILGGHILDTNYLDGEMILTILQAPLTFWDKPKSKDHSGGRFIVSHKGFLKSENYYKDQRVTVAGTIVGSMGEKVESCPSPCLNIKSREICVWPEYNPVDDDFDRWDSSFPSSWYRD